MDDRATERQALFPAARQGAGQLALAAGQVRHRDQLGDAPPLLAGRQLIDAGVELEILLHRQVVVEREALRHVADPLLDRLRLARDVEA